MLYNTNIILVLILILYNLCYGKLYSNLIKLKNLTIYIYNLKLVYNFYNLKFFHDF
jgi:hypothetical protein